MMKLLTLFLITWMSLLPVAQAITGNSFEQPLLEDQLLEGGPAIQSYCFSSLFLDPNRAFQEITELYQHRQNCLFASAYKEFVNTESKTAQKTLKNPAVQSGYKFDTVTSDLAQCDLIAQNIFSDLENTTDIEAVLADQTTTGKIDLRQIQAAQNAPDFCSENGDNTGKDYSLCRVSLAAHNELCAFQEYGAIKLRNEIFIRDCENERLAGQMNECVRESKAALTQNLEAAKRLMDQRLKLYETRTEDTYLHLLLVVFQEQLENAYRGLDLIRTALEKWPSKFHDAASQKAGSLPSK